MVTEVQISPTEITHILHQEQEIPIILTREILQTILLEVIIITQQELTLRHNQQETAMNLLRCAPTLQVLIPDPIHHHLHMEVEVMEAETAVVEDHHLVVEEDKKN